MTEEQYELAVKLVRDKGDASTAFIQRNLLVGYSVAAEIVTRMQTDGIVSEPDFRGKRHVIGGKP